MITVRTNSKHSIEKQYISDFIFSTVLKIDYQFEIRESLDSILIDLNNAKVLELKTPYFNLKSIIDTDALPQESKKLLTEQSKEDLPIFYGEPKLTEDGETTVIHFDLFGMIFFMLTRWEEFVIGAKDHHGRFPAKESFAHKNKFLDRPIVNELIDFLKNILKSKGIITKTTKSYRAYVTHDIDHLYYPVAPKKFIADLVKRRSLFCFSKRMKYKKVSPYNNFEWMLEQSEKFNHISSFYFMTSAPSPQDNDYQLDDDRIKNAIKLIQDKGHIVGIHPSYNSLKNLQKLSEEKEAIEETFNLKISEGRQHFLRFQAPFTWRDWEEAGLEVDSTLGYAEAAGFRCGTGHEFQVFDFLDRKVLKLKERPLIFMDTTARYYQGLTPQETYEQILDLKEKCVKFDTPFTLLFHNSSFDEIEWKGYKELYPKILKGLKD